MVVGGSRWLRVVAVVVHLRWRLWIEVQMVVNWITLTKVKELLVQFIDLDTGRTLSLFDLLFWVAMVMFVYRSTMCAYLFVVIMCDQICVNRD